MRKACVSSWSGGAQMSQHCTRLHQFAPLRPTPRLLRVQPLRVGGRVLFCTCRWHTCALQSCPTPMFPAGCSRSALAGEYRGILNLCRVLPLGLDAKAAVDEAINRCAALKRGPPLAAVHSGLLPAPPALPRRCAAHQPPNQRPGPAPPPAMQVRRHRQPPRRHPRLQGGGGGQRAGGGGG